MDMEDVNNTMTPGSASEWYDLGVFYRRNARFGDAINAFLSAAEVAEDEALKAKAMASVALIQEINGFVNADLMNP